MIKSLNERGKDVLSPVLGRYFTEFEVSSGKGCYLYGRDGKKYLDFASGIGVTSTGHCHPEVVNAIKKQAEELIHTCIGIAFYEPPVILGEKLQELLPSKNYSFFFNQSGSEAIEASIKLAKYITGKPHIIAFKGGFHGRSLGALSLTTSKDKYREGYTPLLEETSVSFPYPRCYRCPWNKDPDSCNTYCIDAFEKFIEPVSSKTAGIMIEPVLGEGGYVPAPEIFMRKLRRICDDKKILLILDEVQSGTGRTGKWFAFEHYNIEPDILAIAKGIASGMPLGVCAAKKELMAKWTPGAHGGTYGSNPVSTVAGIATLEVLKKHIHNVQESGSYALDVLRNNLKEHRFTGDIRGIGLMIAVEFVKDKDSREPYQDLVRTVMNECLSRGLVIISCGIEDNVIRIIPPLTIEKKELERGLDIFLAVLNENS
ncbi:MAG: aminotransferase class III-fold pyridoxal phosphate-dependent enzyme [bacterium]|nr:aminotransferase class III-fold pyridoxal phosphate-dependent enzyme [bacterium]